MQNAILKFFLSLFVAVLPLSCCCFSIAHAATFASKHHASNQNHCHSTNSSDSQSKSSHSCECSFYLIGASEGKDFTFASKSEGQIKNDNGFGNLFLSSNVLIDFQVKSVLFKQRPSLSFTGQVPLYILHHNLRI